METELAKYREFLGDFYQKPKPQNNPQKVVLSRIFTTVHLQFPEFFKLDIDETGRLVRGYELDSGRIASVKMLFGLFSLLTIGLDWDARTALGHYSLRDEQEKYFEQMKDQMAADRQRNWSEDGKTGRLFVLFVSLILSSHVRHVWKATSLKKMRGIRLRPAKRMREGLCLQEG